MTTGKSQISPLKLRCFVTASAFSTSLFTLYVLPPMVMCHYRCSHTGISLPGPAAAGGGAQVVVEGTM